MIAIFAFDRDSGGVVGESSMTIILAACIWANVCSGCPPCYTALESDAGWESQRRRRSATRTLIIEGVGDALPQAVIDGYYRFDRFTSRTSQVNGPKCTAYKQPTMN